MTTTTTKADILDADQHRQMGAHLFNHVWTLLEAEDRTTQQDDEMVHAAHASRWHWGQSGVSDIRQRLAVGEWQCSRVYCRARPRRAGAVPCAALRRAGRGKGIEDWAVAAAYEAMARASRVAGDRHAFEDVARAGAHGDRLRLAAEEDREVIENDLRSLGD